MSVMFVQQTTFSHDYCFISYSTCAATRDRRVITCFAAHKIEFSFDSTLCFRSFFSLSSGHNVLKYARTNHGNREVEKLTLLIAGIVRFLCEC
jgi:hypothetical protein